MSLPTGNPLKEPKKEKAPPTSIQNLLCDIFYESRGSDITSYADDSTFLHRCSQELNGILKSLESKINYFIGLFDYFK